MPGMLFCKAYRALMRNIDGKKYHLLYLISVFVFAIFCRPRLQNEWIWSYDRI